MNVRRFASESLSDFLDLFASCLVCRMTLLLGPPSSGKTTFMLALAGKMNKTLDVNSLNS